MTSDKNITLFSLWILISIGMTGCNLNSTTTSLGSSPSESSGSTNTSSTSLSTPAISVTSTTSSAIALSWTSVTGATSYTLFVNGSSVLSTANTTYTYTTITITITTGTQYCFTVRANSAQSNSAVSSQACTTPASSSGSASNNVMQVTVNGSLCSAATTSDSGYVNKPCASVTICQPGTNTCQTVSDILIDTGSYGLRVFPSGTNANGSSYSLSSLNLAAVTQSGSAVATCAQFLDGSALWGQVVQADVILVSGGERASSIPIQLINSSYGGKVPSDCDSGDAASDAEDAGFNGILGIGLWAHDCGIDCDPAYNSTVQATGIETTYYPYYTCSGNNCSQALVSVSNQVANPISAFPVNNNGLIFEIPSISSSGATSLSGSIILGIGTGGNSNNKLSSSAHVYYADEDAYFATIFNGVTYSDSSTSSSIMGSFIDSGSNSYLFVPPSGVSCCEQNSSGDVLNTTVSCSSSSSSGWVCSSYSGSITNESVGYTTGAPSGTGVAASFNVESFYTLASGSNMVFSDLAAADESSSSNPGTFDFGLPFFFGRNIYVSFEKKSGTTLESQPYWAY
jgi:hypothetical protein